MPPRSEVSDLDIERQLLRWIEGDTFSCLAARAAARREIITVGIYPDLGDPAADHALHADLTAFASHRLGEHNDFASFVAVFRAPAEPDEAAFERGLWDRLNGLHRIDAARHAWSPEVSADPASPEFGFSLAGQPYFVAGLNPGASRISRRFAYPALVFNSHHQFRRLKNSGVYFGLQRRIRAREMALQGSVNPMLAEHGTVSEAAQYSGRAVGTDWKCPFHPQHRPG